ncbi:winged helix-turn-helix domain-containing protein [candidate division CSSED10-310 bacterium]|uniref:Winged helix-turn-helix domain-containing protein n=1 Tax=candidate division CSSED10-310 bacterium TaxID=2855610 RepID=A0ABV6YZ31_UNCC1
MINKIGQTAGLIWKYLDQNGPQSASALKKGIKCDQNIFNWGLGWLVREGKVIITKEKVKYTISLSETK